eukprot:162699_1
MGSSKIPTLRLKKNKSLRLKLSPAKTPSTSSLSNDTGRSKPQPSLSIERSDGNSERSSASSLNPTVKIKFRTIGQKGLGVKKAGSVRLKLKQSTETERSLSESRSSDRLRSQRSEDGHSSSNISGTPQFQPPAVPVEKRSDSIGIHGSGFRLRSERPEDNRSNINISGIPEFHPPAVPGDSMSFHGSGFHLKSERSEEDSSRSHIITHSPQFQPPAVPVKKARDSIDQQTDLTAEQRSEIKEIFEFFDIEKRGVLSVIKSADVIRACGIPITNDEIEHDLTLDGTRHKLKYSDIEEFVTSWVPGKSIRSELDMSEFAFDTLAMGEDSLQVAEFQAMLMDEGDKMSQTEMRSIMANFSNDDITKDQFLDFISLSGKSVLNPQALDKLISVSA